MKILIVSPEVYPFYKSGGLGDVAGSLARSLRDRGHDVRTVMPAYRFVDRGGNTPQTVMPEVAVAMDGTYVYGAVEYCDDPMPVYLIRCDKYFDREGAYGEVVVGQLRDYPDNIERFAFFCMATLWMLKGLDWRPDVIHCNDWQTALLPVLLRHHPIIAADPFYSAMRTVYSIHNLAFQGRTTKGMLPRMGLDPNLYHIEGLEFYGHVNLMKGGIVYSDRITTVSPRYAEEIQTEALGCGLDGLLQTRRDRLSGILNGIDIQEWDPATDPHLPAHYSVEDLSGKAVCKARLQKELGLAVDPRRPLLGMVSRLSTQKGFELVDGALASLMVRDIQLTALGNGEPRYHKMLTTWAKRYPNQVAVNLAFNNGLAHRIEAGADIFLMPSYYEPCGLNQMFSMRYGTPPVARQTGGLADSITHCTTGSLRRSQATGFLFGPYDPRALSRCTHRALDIYEASPEQWRRVIKAGMKKDFSWRSVASRYETVYSEAIRAPRTQT